MKTSVYSLGPAAALLILGTGLAGCGNKCEDGGETYEDGDAWTNSAGEDCQCVEGEVDCTPLPDPCTWEGETYEHEETWVDSNWDLCTCDNGTVLCDTATLLRGVHLVPDLAPPCDLDGDTATPDDIGAACIDLYVEDSTVPLNLDSGPFPFAASTAYVALPLTGTLTFHAVAYGDPNDAAHRLLSIPVTIADGDRKTFVAYGLSAVAVSSDVSDGDVSAPTSGKARVTLFHGEISNLAAAGLDVYLGVGGTKIADDLTYGSYSTSMEVDPTNDVMVVIDTTNDGVPEWVTPGIATTGLTMEADGVYDLFLVLNPTFVDTTPQDGVDDNDPTNPPILLLQHTSASNEPEVLAIFHYVP